MLDPLCLQAIALLEKLQYDLASVITEELDIPVKVQQRMLGGNRRWNISLALLQRVKKPHRKGFLVYWFPRFKNSRNISVNVEDRWVSSVFPDGSASNMGYQHCWEFWRTTVNWTEESIGMRSSLLFCPIARARFSFLFFSSVPQRSESGPLEKNLNFSTREWLSLNSDVVLLARVMVAYIWKHSHYNVRFISAIMNCGDLSWYWSHSYWKSGWKLGKSTTFEANQLLNIHHLCSDSYQTSRRNAAMFTSSFRRKRVTAPRWVLSVYIYSNCT